MRIFIILTCMLHAVFAAPQFLTFNDGKVGVNFGGYHAEAGLFDALTGRGPHASAGTPWGANARAGLGGREGGIAYAGAQASPSVGASTVLGGVSEAHANGIQHSVVATNEHVTPGPVAHEDVPSKDNVIQKIKPPKKYSLIKDDVPAEKTNVVHSKRILKTVSTQVNHPTPNFGAEVEHRPVYGPRVHSVDPNVLHHALNIPIGILSSLQMTLSDLAASKSYQHGKTY